MKRPYSVLGALCLLTSYCAVIAGCVPTELISNPEIDRWCGDRPCLWQVQGQIRRVGTWNNDDYAVELVSDQAELSQTNAGASQISCIEFSMLSKIDAGTRVFVELDFNADGSAEWSQRLPASDYQPMRYVITPPTWYRGVRFIVRKDGPGHAIIAKLRALTTGDCTGAPVPLNGRPDGVSCEKASQCESVACTDGLCGTCGSRCACADADGGC
jgi:hypothetical protein